MPDSIRAHINASGTRAIVVWRDAMPIPAVICDVPA
jgi:hypothetical protein